MTTVIQKNVIGREMRPAIVLPNRRRRLSTVVKRFAIRNRPHLVSVHRKGDALRPCDDTVRLRAQWKHTLISRNDVVVITYLPLGGGSSSGGSNTTKQVGTAIALIALVAAAPYLAAGIGTAAGIGALVGTAASLSTIGQVISAGIVIGGTWLMSKATKPKSASEGDDSRPVYGVSGGGNQPRPGDQIPVHYGTVWTKPDLTQPDYTVYDGEDQVLYKRMTLGLGKYNITQINVGDATFWTAADGVRPPFNYPGSGTPAKTAFGSQATDPSAGSNLLAAVEIINPGETSDLVPASVYSSPDVIGLAIPYLGVDSPQYNGPFPATPAGAPTTRIQLDFSLPSGVYNTSDKTAGALWRVLFEYAPCDADNNATGSYVTLYDSGVQAMNTHRAVRFTKFIDVPSGRYLVRATRGGSSGGATDNPVAIDVAVWDGLRAHYPDTITRPHVTEVAMRIRSGKALGVTSFSEVWVQATRIIPVWNADDEVWEEQETRKAVYALKDILQATYGGNLTDDEVDLETIKSRAASLTEYDTFDGTIRGPVSVYEAAAAVLGPIRGEPARLGSVWSIYRDEARIVRKHNITRRQVVKGSTSANYKISRSEGANDVIVEYSADGDPRRRREVRATFGAQSLTPLRRSVVGVSSYAHAHQIATWMAASAFYRRKRRKAVIELQGRIVRRGDPAWLDAWFMSSATAAGVLSSTGTGGRTLSLDTDVTVDGSTYALLRDRTGREFGPILVTAGAAANIVILDATDLTAAETAAGKTLAEALALDTQDPTSVLIGPYPSDAYLIDSVQPQDKYRVAIEAINDAPEVWTALGEDPPADPGVPSRRDELTPAVPEIGWVRARAVQKATGLEMEWAVGRARGAAFSIVDLSYDDGETWQRVSGGVETAGSYALDHNDATTVKVQAYAVNQNGVPGTPVFTEFPTFKPVLDGDNTEIGVTAFNSPLFAHVTSQLKEAQSKIDKIAQLIASGATEQDAQNQLEKKEDRRLLSVARENLSASIEEVREVAVTTDLAFASYQITTNASLGTLSSSVALNTAAIASLDGFTAAMVSLLLDVNGYVSGFLSTNDGTTSEFTIVADKFKIVKPGVTGGSAIDLFEVGTRNGSPQVTIKGNIIADSIITTNSTVAGAMSAITTGTHADIATMDADNSYHDLVSISHTVVASNNGVLINAGCHVNSFNGSTLVSVTTTLANMFGMTLSIWIDGTKVRELALFPYYFGGTSPNMVWAWYHPNLLSYVATGLSAGSHTITFRYKSGGLNGINPLNFQNILLTAQESRR